MENIQKYYENTKNSATHKNVKKLIDMKIPVGKAIELGCGAGRDTVYLIKNNWNVLAIDRENVPDIIKNRLDKPEYINKFRFQKQNFENIVLEENDLLVANYCLPFCNKDKFQELWEKIKKSISINRIFCREFFWNK